MRKFNTFLLVIAFLSGIASTSNILAMRNIPDDPEAVKTMIRSGFLRFENDFKREIRGPKENRTNIVSMYTGALLSFLRGKVTNAGFDEWFANFTGNSRERLKMALEFLAHQYIKRKNFKRLSKRFPNNFFKKVSLNVAYYLQTSRNGTRDGSFLPESEIFPKVITELNKFSIPINHDYYQENFSIDLSSSRLSSSRSERSDAQRLTTFSLELFIDIVARLEKSHRIFGINLFGNQLTQLPENIGKLTNLDEVYLSTNKITRLPESIGNLIKLAELNLFNNQIIELPDSISKLQGLTKLNLSNNKITQLPDSISKLQGLKELNLSNNKITQLPESIGNIKYLEELNLSNNKITQLPENIGELKYLGELNLSNNRITGLPESIGRLIELYKLNLSNNDITELPESIGRLIELEQLDLSNNDITELPENIGNLTKLRRLFLNNNPITGTEKTRLKRIFGDKLEIDIQEGGIDTGAGAAQAVRRDSSLLGQYEGDESDIDTEDEGEYERE